jgi:thiol-disulfide isomerase/thioredoxin
MNKIKTSFSFIPVIFFSLLLFCAPAAKAQSIPPFKMALTTGKIFSAATDLPKGKPVILIYFDPDCDHCQKLMGELFKKIDQFKKAEIVLITFKPVTEVAAFEKQYGIQKYSNIKLGTEGTAFYLRNYYRLVKMPFTVLYDKKGDLSYYYREVTYVDDLIKRLKDIK